MLEALIAHSSRACGQAGRKLLERAAVVPAGVWIAALVLMAVGARALSKHAARPAHLDALADESASLSFLLSNQKLQLNHAGTRILFCHSSEKGMGVYVCDRAGGGKKLVFEEDEIHFGLGPNGVLTVFPWSPDDRWFVYARQGPGAINAEVPAPFQTELVLCRAETGGQVASFIAPFGKVVALDWLSRDAFVYVSGTDGHDFMLAQRQDDSTWKQSKLTRPETAPAKIDNRINSLAAISSNTIVWLQANCLWQMNVESGATAKLYDFPKDKFFTAFDYSSATRQLLLSCIESNADSLWRMPLDEPGGLERIATDIRAHDNSWNDAVWIQGAQTFAFIRPPGNRVFGLVLKTNAAADQAVLFQQDHIHQIAAAPGGKHLLMAGSINGQPGSGIWEYEVASGKARCIVAAADQPAKRLRQVRSVFMNIRLSADQKLDVLIFPPLNYDPRKPGNYPIVITSTRYVSGEPHMAQYGEVLANAGAFFVMINKNWSQKSLGTWAYNVNSLYKYLVQLPGIDPQRVFFLSTSRQSVGLMKLLTEHPGECKGAILNVPSVRELSRPSELAVTRHPLRILISAEGDCDFETPLRAYQENACAEGMYVAYLTHPGACHQFIAKHSQRARMRAMLHFVFDD